MKNLKVILITGVVVIGMFFILDGIAHRDQQVMEAGDKYQKCVEDQYGMSPSYYYQETGKYPECK